MSEIASVYDVLKASAARFGSQPLLCVPPTVAATYGIEAREHTYAEVLNGAHRLRDIYRNAGYGHGHRVALMIDNRPVFFDHWFALNALGASVVPINPELAATEHAYLLQLSESCLFVYTAVHEEIAHQAVAGCPTAINVCAVEDIEELAPASPMAGDHAIEQTTECAMLFTSGSTGQPKACVLTNEYFLEMGRWYREMGGLCALVEGAERLATPLPLTHMNAMATSLMAMLSSGGCLIQLDRFHPQTWWETVRDARATIVHYLGVMPAILLQLEERATDRNPQIKFGFGAGVNPAHHERFEQRFGFPLIEGWAMTETGAGGCIAANREPRHVGQSCFGQPDPARVEFRLVDEAGQDVAFGQAGELLVRAVGKDPARGFFAGYYRNEAATKEGWDGGWWHTGDVVRQLDDGAMCFVDRRKNIIRRSGENIAALEVEAVLSRHPATRVLAVTPAPDEIRGEEVMACIVLDPTFEPSEALAVDIFTHCHNALAYFKTPGYVVFVDALPLTATQKPKRNEIKLLARTLLEENGGSAHLFDLRTRKRKNLA